MQPRYNVIILGHSVGVTTNLKEAIGWYKQASTRHSHNKEIRECLSGRPVQVTAEEQS